MGVAHPEAFSNWRTPTAAELNSNLVHVLSCALNEDGTSFNLTDSDTDDTLTFCQEAGVVTPTRQNAEVIFEAERSDDPLAVNTANEAFGLLAFPDIEYFAFLRIGKDSDAPFAIGDRVSLIRVATDYPVDVVGSGENVRLQQNFLFKSDILWRYEVAA